ncbi:TRAP transporter substrate-binding protein [Bradyrhizobium genosp. SA-3]|uniref:TRAP transporter substrate-binding protein n=1 Tax=Bradyrhizobium genosp. SA-3 TaxID=508868 RepID=UPI001FE13EA4|nr:TRAP transporter substrate-binding protein [Bradyrhizobium genosp. SA-3]
MLGSLASAAAFGPVVLSGRARAAEFTIKFGHDLTADHPMNVRALEAAKRIAEKSSGRVELAVFPSNQLGGQTDMISQVRSGATEFVAMSGVILGGFVPVAAISGVGFAFADYEQVWGAMDGSLGQHIKAAIERAGLIAFDRVWDNGFRQTTAGTKPIVAPADFAGFKIRVPVAKLWTSLFEALGASPASINFNETYGALQTKIVDGMENALATLYTSRIYEVQKYCSMTNHMWDGFWMIGNRAAWQRLPAPLQGIVHEEITKAVLDERADTERLNQNLRRDLEQKGMIFNATSAPAFREALTKVGFYANWKKTFGNEAWDLLEKSAGRLS